MTLSEFQPQLPPDAPSFQPSDPEAFFDRRRFLQMTAMTGIAGLSAACVQDTPNVPEPTDARLIPPLQRPDVFPVKPNARFALPTAVDGRLTTQHAAASHNNFYEFFPDGGGAVWKYTDNFVVDPWKVEISGLCAKPMTIDLDDLFKFDHEERLYHFRCVETWAMNVPWSGFPLSKLLEKVEPKSDAKFVRFTTANRPEQMPGLKTSMGRYPWPFFEALRLDEAMNELAMVVTGIYGKPLLKQHGAPLRIIVPWKYGYKNPKSIVKIELLPDPPQTFWSQKAPHEYGFLSNVNPNIPHPRWSQSRSYLLGVDKRGEGGFDTPIYNGYGKYVAHLYPDEPTTLQTKLSPGQIAR